jgi:hypothetical protein
VHLCRLGCGSGDDVEIQAWRLHSGPCHRCVGAATRRTKTTRSRVGPDAAGPMASTCERVEAIGRRKRLFRRAARGVAIVVAVTRVSGVAGA